ncbi:hypothetical protein [Dawidia soli]|uniref:Porin n=1 Tax=Dawidia soli TaxID=2782352 RepID=A0AAP2GFI8_9BACT|nr:hypothetical protein [Dawidia soli]MBT1689557.1 hypothetical protein [Dawidia soli]
MKTVSRITLLRRLPGFLLLTLLAQIAAAQAPIQYFRQYDQRGIGVFETSKNDTVPFNDLKLRVGGNFTQSFQTLSHSNESGVPLYDLGNGFPLAQANLNLDFQLADGVRVNLISYMSSHHHNEMWVKAGYFQIDKVGFLNSELLNNLWKNLTLKIGHMEINYGDAHFRRSDGGNAFWNPFIENNILDAYTTEIGAELYWQKNGFLLMGGMTNGEIQGSVTAPNKRSPSVYGKVGYDKVLAERTRIRLTGSLLRKSSSVNGTLFRGDRTGSNYQFVMEPANATVTANAFSGRINPNFSDDVTTFVINPFVQFHGLELFGTVEFAEGNTAVENGEVQYTPAANDATRFNKLEKRKFDQVAVDLLYRFGKADRFYVGARYNKVSGTQVFGSSTTVATAGGISQGTRLDVSQERTAFGGGWFITRNILLKGEYVTQKFNDYPAGDILQGGKFDGFVFQGTIAF